jgi:hypothetical protein
MDSLSAMSETAAHNQSLSKARSFVGQHAVLLLCIAGLAVRAIMLLLIDPGANLTGGDSAVFLAQKGGGFEAPGYPLFLSVFPSPLFFQSLLTLAVGLLILRKIGALPALLYVSLPFLVIYEWRVLSEALAINLLVVGCVLAAYSSKPWEPIIGGVLVGLAILTRDTLLLLPLAVPIMALILRRHVKRALIFVAAAYLAILPWQVSNGAISKGRMGLNLWIGTWETNPDWLLGGLDNFPREAFRDNLEHRELQGALARHDDGPFIQAAIEKMRRQPLAVLKTWAIRYPRLWIGTRTDQIEMRLRRGSLAWTVTKSSFFALNLATLIAGFLGMILAVRKGRDWAFGAVPILYIGVTYIPFHITVTRYSLPALPFLLLFAAYAAAAFKRAKLGTGTAPNAPPDSFRV